MVLHLNGLVHGVCVSLVQFILQTPASARLFWLAVSRCTRCPPGQMRALAEGGCHLALGPLPSFFFSSSHSGSSLDIVCEATFCRPCGGISRRTWKEGPAKPRRASERPLRAAARESPPPNSATGSLSRGSVCSRLLRPRLPSLTTSYIARGGDYIPRTSSVRLKTPPPPPGGTSSGAPPRA